MNIFHLLQLLLKGRDHTDSVAALTGPESTDLSGLDIPALSIFGANDNVPNIPHFEDMKAFMPVKTTYVPIEGASHAQFGDYGPQKGDVKPHISLDRQHEIVTEKMLTFISKL